MKSLAGLFIFFTLSFPVLAWDVPAGQHFSNEQDFTNYLALNLDCEWGDPIPVSLGTRIPWAGHDYYQLKDGSWMAKGSMLCHHKRAPNAQDKMVISHWTVGFELKPGGEIITNGHNTRRYQGYDVRNLGL